MLHHGDFRFIKDHGGLIQPISLYNKTYFNSFVSIMILLSFHNYLQSIFYDFSKKNIIERMILGYYMNSPSVNMWVPYRKVSVGEH